MTPDRERGKGANIVPEAAYVQVNPALNVSKKPKSVPEGVREVEKVVEVEPPVMDNATATEELP